MRYLKALGPGLIFIVDNFVTLARKLSAPSSNCNMENKRPLTNVALPHFAEVTKVFKFVESDDGDESEKGKWEELAKGVVRFAKMTTGKTRLQLQDKSKSGTGFKLNMMIQDKTPLQLVNDRHVYVRAQRSCVHRRHTIALTSLLSTLSLPHALSHPSNNNTAKCTRTRTSLADASPPGAFFSASSARTTRPAS